MIPHVTTRKPCDLVFDQRESYDLWDSRDINAKLAFESDVLLLNRETCQNKNFICRYLICTVKPLFRDFSTQTRI